MYQTDDRDVALLKVILPLMSHHAAGYHPISYTVWYEYAKGSNQALHLEVDETLRQDSRLTVGSTYTLYIKHLVEPAQHVLLNARSGLLSVVDKVGSTVREIGQGTSHFAAQVSEFRGALAGSTSIEALDGRLESIGDEASRLNLGLERIALQLDQNRIEVDRLTEELSQLREDAQTDVLSGLLNRRGLERALLRLAPGPEAPAQALSMILFDIDHFKAINDTYGHPLGDVVISTVGRLIRECVAGAGSAARYGGEEFVVLLPGQPIAAAERMARTICKRIEEGKIRRRQDDSPIAGITMSAGVAAWQPGGTAEALIEHADRALYASKRAGRNLVTVYDPQLHG